jgi:type I restriction enzyme S subunit
VRFDQAKVDPRYAYLFFASKDYWDQVNEGASGTGQPNFNGTKLAALRIPVPPLAEQRRIAARIEALFARTRRARTDLERIAPLSSRYEKAVRDEALRRGLDAGWPERMLGEIVSEVRNGIAAKPADEPPGVPILRISAVRDGRVHLGDKRYHRGESTADTRKYLLKNQDLLFIRFNGNPALVAACGMVRELTGESVYPDKLIRVRLNTAAAVPEFVEMAAGSLMARHQLADYIKTAAGQHGISGSDLKTLRLPMPDLATQQRVAAEVATKRDAALRADREAALALTLLDRLEKSILARAFRGELVQQEPAEIADQPAPQAALSPASAGRRGRRAAA